MVAHAHRTHPQIVNRLKRADGHLRTAIGMLEAGRPCTELAQQLHAIEKALAAAKKTLIHDHIDHCLSDATDDPVQAKRAMAELKSLTKYL